VYLGNGGTDRLVDRLGDAGYVARVPGRDARWRSPRQTTTGTAVAWSARIARIARERAIARTLGKLSDTERIALTELCERLVSTLAKQRLEQRAAGFTPAGGALCRMCVSPRAVATKAPVPSRKWR